MSTAFRLRIATLLALVLLPSASSADWKTFLPTPVQRTFALEGFGSYEKDTFGGTAVDSDWNDSFVKERLSLESAGFVYHPRFLRYRLTLGAVFGQESYESVTFSPDWHSRRGLEYNLGITVLPEHRYNLQLDAARFEPVFKEHVATSHDRVGTLASARFRYEDRPYFARAAFVRTTTSYGEASSSEVRRGTAEGKYLKDLEGGDEVSAEVSFNPVWSSSSAGFSGTSQELFGGSNVKKGRYRLYSSVTALRWAQEHGGTSDGDSHQFVWQERGDVHLPWRLRTDGTWRYHDNATTFLTRGPDSALSDKGHDLQVNVEHRLYESLDTTYGLIESARSSLFSSTSNLSQGLALSYHKLIPHGSLMVSANGSGGTLDSEGGATSVVDEPHAGVAIPSVFALDQQNALPASVTVMLKSPIPPFERITLVPGAHYAVSTVAARVEIQVFALPPPFVVPGSYDLLVSYELVGGDFSIRNRAYGVSTSVGLFQDLLTTWAGYSSANSKVVSGVFPGIPTDSNTTTVGMRLARGPWRATGEYADLDWDYSPRTTWKARLDYSNSSLGPATGLVASVSWERQHYRVGDLMTTGQPFDEDNFTVSADGQKRLRHPRMWFTAGGAWSRLQRNVDANALSWNFSWNWKIGKVELDAGASVYRYHTIGNAISAYSRDHELFFVKLRRDLF